MCYANLNKQYNPRNNETSSSLSLLLVYSPYQQYPLLVVVLVSVMSVLPRCTRPLARHVRSFHGSLVRADLVGPPDPVSHLRPVIYDDAPAPPSPTSHPYSLREFAGDTREYQWKVQRQETDAFNQAFWTDVRPFTPYHSPAL